MLINATRRADRHVPNSVDLWSCSALLDDMCQFVGEQPLPFCCLWRILSVTENNVLPDGVSCRSHAARRLCCFPVSVDTHLGKIVPESRLHEAPGCRVQRLAS